MILIGIGTITLETSEPSDDNILIKKHLLGIS